MLAACISSLEDTHYTDDYLPTKLNRHRQVRIFQLYHLNRMLIYFGLTFVALNYADRESGSHRVVRTGSIEDPAIGIVNLVRASFWRYIYCT